MRARVSVGDVSRAYFNAPTDPNDPCYVQLPAEDPDSSKGLCGHLQVHTDGTRRVA